MSSIHSFRAMWTLALATAGRGYMIRGFDHGSTLEGLICCVLYWAAVRTHIHQQACMPVPEVTPCLPIACYKTSFCAHRRENGVHLQIWHT